MTEDGKKIDVKDFIEYEKLLIGGVYEVSQLSRAGALYSGHEDDGEKYHCRLKKTIGRDFLHLEGRQVSLGFDEREWFARYIREKEKLPLAFVIGGDGEGVFPLTDKGMKGFKEKFKQRMDLLRAEYVYPADARKILDKFSPVEETVSFFDAFMAARAFANVDGDYLKLPIAGVKVEMLKKTPGFGKIFAELETAERIRLFGRLDEIEKNEIAAGQGILYKQCKFLHGLFLIQYARKQIEKTVLLFMVDTLPRLLEKVFPTMDRVLRARMIGNLNRRLFVLMRDVSHDIDLDIVVENIGKLLSETLLEFLGDEIEKRGLALDRFSGNVKARWRKAVEGGDFIDAYRKKAKLVAFTPFTTLHEIIESKACSPAHRDFLNQLIDAKDRLGDDYFIRTMNVRLQGIESMSTGGAEKDVRTAGRGG